MAETDHPSPTRPLRRMGLIVNPIAGMGGAVALKGTDGASAEAARRGAVPRASERAARALARLRLPRGVAILAAGGPMGETIARASGLDPIPVTLAPPVTTAADTRAAAEAMRGEGAELILFAGGDGTARDIQSVVGRTVPLLGAPTGVKMHSAVFAASPEAAGMIATDLFRAEPGGARFRDAEVLDIDEAMLRAGVISTRLHGLARVPIERRLMQQAKIGARSASAALEAACVQVARALTAGCVHLIGPGSTTQMVMRALGLPGTLLGIDAVRDGGLIGSDLSAAEIANLVGDGPVRIVIGVVGGQGFLFGRGNQQIGADVIRRAGRDGIAVLADFEKIAALESRALHVDTGDRAVDAMLRGHIRVQTAPDQFLLCKVLC